MRINKLEEAGLVKRDRDPDDRRIVYARLTDRGLRVVDAAATAHFAHKSRMLACLTANDRKQLARLFGKLERSIMASETARQQ